MQTLCCCVVGRGVFHKLAGDLHHINYQLVENRGDSFFWEKLEEVEFDWNAYIQDVFVVHSIDSQGEDAASRRFVRIVLMEFACARPLARW